MRKFFVFSLLVCFSMVSGAINKAEAQESQNLVYFNYEIERIWPHQMGYVVQYRLPGNRVNRTYIPIEWFSTGDGRGELLRLNPGESWPSMTIFMRDGAFHYVRLNLHNSPSHASWGEIPQTRLSGLRSYFEGVETLEPVF